MNIIVLFDFLTSFEVRIISLNFLEGKIQKQRNAKIQKQRNREIENLKNTEIEKQ